MNLHSAELLESSLQAAADNLARNRALNASIQEEAQRNAIEQSFRNAMMQHYANIEQRQADTADRQAGTIQQQQQQAGIAQKQNFLRTAMQLNATGQLSPDGLKRVNQWLSTDPDMSRTGIQLSAPSNPSNDPAHQQTALANALALRQQYQSKFDGEPDPNKKSQYGKVLDDIDASLGGKRSIYPLPRNHPGQPNANLAVTVGPQSSPTSLVPALGNIGLNANGIPTGKPVQPDPRDIQWLSASPTAQRIAKFESIYGQGSSSPFLNSTSPPAQ
ncbi:MAG TPA: hypothetical protein VGY98_02585 [Verrucomicrobiae bacterium]|nr:hypothetical protein [Verrucomicrobiae bacterium]